MSKDVQPGDDAMEYIERAQQPAQTAQPICNCDAKELALGVGHDPSCPYYRRFPDATDDRNP
jgi:hypothetical protein